MKKPKQQEPTTEEKVLRSRQVDELARLDDDENTRVKGLVRGRMGAGSLLGGRRSGGRGRSRAGGPVTYTGGGGAGVPQPSTGGPYGN